MPTSSLEGKGRTQLKKCRNKLVRLKSIFENLEAENVNEPLKAREGLLGLIVRTFDELPPQSDIQKLLNNVKKPGPFSTQDTDSLADSIGKIRRYSVACKFLIQAAPRKNVFANVQVASLMPLAPLNAPLPPQVSISTAAGRLLRSQKLSKRALKGLKSDLLQNQNRFNSRMNSSNHRVHAEVQLIYFYESHPEIHRPRVISSNKDACFLCNLFIDLHGAFFTSFTHGMIYPAWGLPALDQADVTLANPAIIESTIARFNAEIENTIKRVAQPDRKHWNHPKESRVNLSTWIGSVLSLAKSVMSEPNLAPPPTASSVAKSSFPRYEPSEAELRNPHPVERKFNGLENDSISNERLPNASSKEPFGISEKDHLDVGEQPNEFGPNASLHDHSEPTKVDITQVLPSLENPSDPSHLLSPNNSQISLHHSQQLQLHLSPHQPSRHLKTPHIHLSLTLDSTHHTRPMSGSSQLAGKCDLAFELLRSDSDLIANKAIIDIDTISTSPDEEMRIDIGDPLLNHNGTIYLRRRDTIVKVVFSFD